MNRTGEQWKRRISKLGIAAALGSCLALAAAVPAFAASAAVPASAPSTANVGHTIMPDSRGAGSSAGGGTSSSSASFDAYGSERLKELHLKIDQFVFAEKSGNFEEQGFKVTNTGPIDGYIEIGILPYQDDYADYLYDVFGKELVKVVEGVQALPLAAGEIPPAAGIVVPQEPRMNASAADAPISSAIGSAADGHAAGETGDMLTVTTAAAGAEYATTGTGAPVDVDAASAPVSLGTILAVIAGVVALAVAAYAAARRLRVRAGRQG